MKKIIIMAGILLLAAGCSQVKKVNQENKTNESNKTYQSNESKQTQETQNIPQGEKEGWETYTNSSYGFTIQYPKNEFKEITRENYQFTGIQCQQEQPGTKVVCLEYPKDNLADKGTNFIGAGVIVTVADLTDKCYMPQGNEAFIEKVINGETFKAFSGGGGAAGSSNEIRGYRTIRNNRCFEIVLDVASTEIGNYPPGTVKKFNEKEVWNELEQVLSTFQFTKTVSNKEKMKVKVYVIVLEDNGKSGKFVGCGDSVMAIEKEVEKSSASLKASLEALLGMKGNYVGESGLYNPLANSNLKVESVSIDKSGKAIIKLSGELVSWGTCDDPRIEAQIRETATQFVSVKSVEIFINNTSLSESLSGKGQIVKVKVFFVNYKKQKDPNSCNELFALEREVDKTSAVATAAITELLKGPSLEEKALGYTSGLPNGSKLKSLKIVNGIAYADFNQATDNTGGSCNPLAEQIKQTLMQFTTAKSVVLSIDGRTEGIFQP